MANISERAGALLTGLGDFGLGIPKYGQLAAEGAYGIATRKSPEELRGRAGEINQYWDEAPFLGDDINNYREYLKEQYPGTVTAGKYAIPARAMVGAPLAAAEGLGSKAVYNIYKNAVDPRKQRKVPNPIPGKSEKILKEINNRWKKNPDSKYKGQARTMDQLDKYLKANKNYFKRTNNAYGESLKVPPKIKDFTNKQLIGSSIVRSGLDQGIRASMVADGAITREERIQRYLKNNNLGEILPQQRTARQIYLDHGREFKKAPSIKELRNILK